METNMIIDFFRVLQINLCIQSCAGADHRNCQKWSLLPGSQPSWDRIVNRNKRRTSSSQALLKQLLHKELQTLTPRRRGKAVREDDCSLDPRCQAMLPCCARVPHLCVCGLDPFNLQCRVMVRSKRSCTRKSPYTGLGIFFVLSNCRLC